MGHLQSYDYEMLSTMQKSFRRGEERLAVRSIFAMLDGDTPPGIVFSRLKVCVLEDLGPDDPTKMLLALRLIDLAYEGRVKSRESFMWRMAISNLAVLLCRATKWRIGNSLAAAAKGDNDRLGPPAAPDWALDQHTSKGKSMGRGLDHFFRVGAFCKDLSPLDDPHFDAAVMFWTGGKGYDPETGEPGEDEGTDLFSGS